MVVCARMHFCVNDTNDGQPRTLKTAYILFQVRVLIFIIIVNVLLFKILSMQSKICYEFIQSQNLYQPKILL